MPSTSTSDKKYIWPLRSWSSSTKRYIYGLYQHMTFIISQEKVMKSVTVKISKLLRGHHSLSFSWWYQALHPVQDGDIQWIVAKCISPGTNCLILHHHHPFIKYQIKQHPILMNKYQYRKHLSNSILLEFYNFSFLYTFGSIQPSFVSSGSSSWHSSPSSGWSSSSSPSGWSSG